MVTNPEMKQIQEQKELLLAQSELYRRMLEFQYTQLETRTAWVDAGVRLVRSAGPILTLSAPVAAYLVLRKRPWARRLVVKGFGLWRFVRRASRRLAEWK